jgi:hypothetical protein
MGLRDWLDEFERLHARARACALSGEELRRYEDSREELVRVVLSAQRLSLKAGQIPRERLRVQVKLEVRLKLRGWGLVASTLDVSSGGFAALLSYASSAGERGDATLLLPRGVRVETRASVGAVTRSGAAFRTSFIFEGLSTEARTALELLVFDIVLAELRQAG